MSADDGWYHLAFPIAFSTMGYPLYSDCRCVHSSELNFDQNAYIFDHAGADDNTDGLRVIEIRNHEYTKPRIMQLFVTGF